jgi:ribosomal protein S18 acetylase RimI-like enzyme
MARSSSKSRSGSASGSAPSSAVVIRRAEERDLPTLGRLGALLVRAHHAFDRARFLRPSTNVEEGYAWFLGTQLEEPDVAVLVAEAPPEVAVDSEVDAEILGYVYAGLEPMSWKELREAAGFIHDVVVTEAARGRGIGARLVDEAAAWLESRGAPRIMLWTAERNAPAQRLFARLGFRRTMIEMTRERRGPET